MEAGSTTDSRPEVLIVEDEESLAELFGTYLADEYITETAHSAEAALERIHPGTDVVLLDRRLPGMSGEEFLDRIRGHDADYQVVMVSGVDPTEEILKLAIDEYIVKPVRNTHPTPRFPACVPENIPSRPPAVRTSLSALPDLNEPRRSCSLPAVATRACDSSAHIGSG